MRKRRISIILLSMVMLMSLLWGCGDEAKKTLKEEGGKDEQADDNQPSSGQVIEDNSEQPDDNGDVNIGDANNNTGTENPDANDTMSENDDTKSDNTKNENTEVSDDVEEIITCRYQLDGTEYYLLNHRKVMYVDKDGNKKELGEFSYDTGGTFEGKDGVCYLLTDDYGTLLVFEPERDEAWKIMYGVSWYKIFDTDRILVETDDEVMHYVNFREFLDETEDIPEDMLPYINPPKLTKPSEYPYAVIETPNKEQQDAYEAFIRKREPVKEEAEKENWTWRVQDGVLKNKEGEVYPDVEHIMPGSLYETESVVYYADCNEIHQMKLDGTDNKVIYVALENVYDIIGTEEYIFFALQNSSWRLHIESGICDFACEHDKGAWLRPLSNSEVGTYRESAPMPLTEGDFPEFFRDWYYSEYDLEDYNYTLFNEKREAFLYYDEDIMNVIDSCYLDENGDLYYKVYNEYHEQTPDVYKQDVCAFYYWPEPTWTIDGWMRIYDTNILYVKNEKEIYCTDPNRYNQYIASAFGTVKEIVGNSIYCFYITDEGIYRLHLGSQTNELVCKVSDASGLVIFDNHSIMFSVKNIASDEATDYYYDMTNKEQGMVKVADMEQKPERSFYVEQATQDY